MCSSNELTFVCRDGRTVLAHSRVTAPMTLVRPFPLAGGAQLVQLITLGPGFCGGDRVSLRITADAGANVVMTTTAATRVLSMHAGAHAEQHVEIVAAAAATVRYYPLVTIPFPDSAFAQSVTIRADRDSRVGVMETWALGRTARDEYLRFTSLSNRTSLHVDGTPVYLDTTELRPGSAPLDGAGVLAGRRYLAAGVFHGIEIPPQPREGASTDELLLAFAQARPRIAYLRALASDAPALDAALRGVSDAVARAWNLAPVALDRFRC